MFSTEGLGTRVLGVMIFLPTLPKCVPQRLLPRIVGHSSNSNFAVCNCVEYGYPDAAGGSRGCVFWLFSFYKARNWDCEPSSDI
jgi:hypothetical protein